VNDAPRAGERGRRLRCFVGSFLDHSKPAGEFGAVFPQRGIVGEHDERLVNVKDAGGTQERARNE
jgi:hypothetical protein